MPPAPGARARRAGRPRSGARRGRPAAVARHRRRAPAWASPLLAERVVAEVGPTARLVPMDGFHLAWVRRWPRLGRAAAQGRAGHLRRERFVATSAPAAAAGADPVRAPEFRRDPGGAGRRARSRCRPRCRWWSPRATTCCCGETPWERGALAAAPGVVPRPGRRAAVAPPDRPARDPRESRRSRPCAWALGSDEENARLVAGTAAHADLVVGLADPAGPTTWRATSAGSRAGDGTLRRSRPATTARSRANSTASG